MNSCLVACLIRHVLEIQQWSVCRLQISDYERIRQYSMKPMPRMNSNKNRANTRGPISAAKKNQKLTVYLLINASTDRLRNLGPHGAIGY